MENDLKKSLGKLFPLEPFAGVDRAWRYQAKTIDGVLQHVVRFGSEGDHLLLLPCRDGFDPELAAALLEFIGDIAPDFFDEKPLRFVPGFSAPNSGFTAVMMLGPEAHNQFEAANPELQALTAVAFPVYSCEFSGDEEVSMVRTLRKYFVSTLDWKRAPQPRLLMMHRNAATGSRSPGQKRGLARLDKCLRELETLTETGESFVEMEALSGDVIRLQRAGADYEAQFPESEKAPEVVAASAVQDFIRTFLLHAQISP
jgi:hypothetical protein